MLTNNIYNSAADISFMRYHNPSVHKTILRQHLTYDQFRYIGYSETAIEHYRRYGIMSCESESESMTDTGRFYEVEREHPIVEEAMKALHKQDPYNSIEIWRTIMLNGVTRLCNFDVNCRKSDCKFFHKGRDSPEFFEMLNRFSNFKRKPCTNGNDCPRKDVCTFAHDASDLRLRKCMRHESLKEEPNCLSLHRDESKEDAFKRLLGNIKPTGTAASTSSGISMGSRDVPRSINESQRNPENVRLENHEASSINRNCEVVNVTNEDKHLYTISIRNLNVYDQRRCSEILRYYGFNHEKITQ